MTEPVVGKTYRWKSNKFVLGKFLSKSSYETDDVSGYDYNKPIKTGKKITVTYYKFENSVASPETLDNLEEVPETGGRKKTRGRKLRRKTVHRK
jgi:hypothetical protein